MNVHVEELSRRRVVGGPIGSLGLNRWPHSSAFRNGREAAAKAKDRERKPWRCACCPSSKEAKEDGGSDEQREVVGRKRERKRDAAAAYRTAGRDELADPEELRPA